MDPSDLPPTITQPGHAVGSVLSVGVPSVEGYEVLEQVGAGGMGTVWRARQQGTRRMVALKLLGNCHINPQGRGRFVREVELSARLEHPNVARVYDSGVHQGIYYYAMEFIEGLDLVSYVRSARLQRLQILQLMRKVCDGVGHAHVRGIIHRDLKPSNILVSADGEPHILDFGLAKALVEVELNRAGFDAAPIAPEPIAPESVARAPMYDESSLAGTLAYMAPEQAAGNLAQLDTRTDVYSLGKILFALLTGEAAHVFKQSDHSAIRLQIATEEVRSPRLVDRTIDRDLEAILLKCLQREPENRYPSAIDFGRDLARYRDNLPVDAMPMTLPYVLRKWWWRHRVRVLLAQVALLVLVAVIVVAAVRIRTAQQRLKDEQVKAVALAENLRYVIEMMRPENSEGRDITSLLLTRANAQAALLRNDPNLQADFREMLGEDLVNLGQFAAAIPQFELAGDLWKRAGSSDTDLRTLNMRVHLADAYREQGRLSDAKTLIESVANAAREKYGPSSPIALEAARTRSLVLTDQNRIGQAITVAQEAYSLVPAMDVTKPYTCEVGRALAIALSLSGDRPKLERALALCEQLLKLREQADNSVKGARRQTLQAMHDMASVLTLTGDYTRAESLYSQALQEGTEQLKPGHPDLLVWRNDRAIAYLRQGLAQSAAVPPDSLGQVAGSSSLEKALHEFDDLLPALELLRGRLHPYTLRVMQNRGDTLVALCRWNDALDVYEEVVRRLTATRGFNDADTLRAVDALAVICKQLERWPELVALCQTARDVRQSMYGPQDSQTLQSQIQLGVALADAGQLPAAVDLLIEAQSICEKTNGLMDATSRRCFRALVGTLTRCKERLGVDDPTTLRALAEAERVAGKLDPPSRPTSIPSTAP